MSANTVIFEAYGVCYTALDQGLGRIAELNKINDECGESDDRVTEIICIEDAMQEYAESVALKTPKKHQHYGTVVKAPFAKSNAATHFQGDVNQFACGADTRGSEETWGTSNATIVESNGRASCLRCQSIMDSLNN